ncbi:MAG TPA: hypothetical protein VNK25_00505 [Candidatus Nitrosotenuis sp.]|nr:hypothetical protein [Candidatus Nitrosotenuis sp.]
MKKLIAVLAVAPLLLITSEAYAANPSVSVEGVLPAQMPNQYLVSLKICAGSEKLDAPKLYVSSDSADTGTLELRAVLAPNSCRYEDITIRAKDPSTIRVSFESPSSSDERIEKLERELAELKKQLGKSDDKKQTKDAKPVTKKVETKKATNEAMKKKTSKADPIKSILLTESDIKDEKSWKVETAYDGVEYLNLPDGIVMDTGVKRVIVQHYTRHDKLYSAKAPWTVESMIKIYKSEKSRQLIDTFDAMKKNSLVNFEETKIANADCLTTKSTKDTSGYACKTGKFLIIVEGLKFTSKTTGKDIAGQIMESLVKKIKDNKIA